LKISKAASRAPNAGGANAGHGAGNQHNKQHGISFVKNNLLTLT